MVTTRFAWAFQSRPTLPHPLTSSRQTGENAGFGLGHLDRQPENASLGLGHLDRKPQNTGLWPGTWIEHFHLPVLPLMIWSERRIRTCRHVIDSS